jgi:hypothetical protein
MSPPNVFLSADPVSFTAMQIAPDSLPSNTTEGHHRTGSEQRVGAYVKQTPSALCSVSLDLSRKYENTSTNRPDDCLPQPQHDRDETADERPS